MTKAINKNALLMTDKKTGKKVLYTSVKSFVDAWPQYSMATIYNYTSRKKKQFEDDSIILEKIPFAK